MKRLVQWIAALLLAQHCLAQAPGDGVWKYNPYDHYSPPYHSDAFDPSPAIGADGTIYIGEYRGRFFALNPDGTKKWDLALEKGIENSTAIGLDGTIYVVAASWYGGDLHALNVNGTERWATTNMDLASSPVLGEDGTIYVGSFWPSQLYAINPVDGAVIWKRADGLNGYRCRPSSPAVAADGKVYYGNLNYGDGSEFYSFSANGTTNWTIPTGIQGFLGSEVVGSPSISPEGDVYFATLFPLLFAAKGSSPLANSAWPKYRQNPRNTGKVERPKLLSATRTADQFQCLVFGELGGSYTVQGSTNLSDWTPLTHFIAATNRTPFVDAIPDGATRNFYRVVMP